MSDAAELERLRALLALREEQVALLKASNERLARENAQLKQQALGTKPERWQPSPEQLALWGLPEEAEPPKPPKKPRKPRKGGRRPLPKELPRETVSCALEPAQRLCPVCEDPTPMKPFGAERAERLAWVRGHFKTLEIVREKCSCPKHPEAGVVTAPGPDFVIDKGLFDNSLVAKLVVDKFADHLPLDRQVRRFRREGVDLALSTVCDAVRQAAVPASFLVRAMQKELVAGRWLQSDATGFKVLEGSRNKPHRGHLYSWSNTERVVYTYAREGTGEHPAQILQGFAGTMVVDGGSSFNAAAKVDGVKRAGCWAHARRKFWEARDTDPVRVHAALEAIREVFQLERAFQELEAADRARQRRALTWPLLQNFQRWCRVLSQGLPPRSPLAKAVGYVLRQWDTLVVFIDDGELPAHNNMAELLLRQPVVGRKNWMFAGSEGGAETAATWFSLIGSCMLNAVDPWLYLNDILPRLASYPANRVLDLEPAAWRRRRLSELGT